MPQWSDYSTGQRIKILRGPKTQAWLAEQTGLSIVTIQKAEQDKALSLHTLLQVADKLNADTAVILGQQAPRRAMGSDDRATVRVLSQMVHDTAAGFIPASIEAAPTADTLRAGVDAAWEAYWLGHYNTVGSIVAPLLGEAAAYLHAQPADATAEAWGFLADAYRLSAYVANLMGARDLAYAAIGHAQRAAEKSADELRPALVASGRAWVYLRDARLEDALVFAEKAAVDIEPRFSTATPAELAVYGCHINFAAVVASRMGDKERAADYLSQSHATGARMGREIRAHGAGFGPQSATTQAVGISVALGQTGKALALIDSIHDVSGLTEAGRNRYAMDKAMAQADAKMWDASLDTLEGVLRAAPAWARHQALPAVIVEKVGRASTTRLRRVSKLIDIQPLAEEFAPATRRTAL